MQAIDPKLRWVITDAEGGVHSRCEGGGCLRKSISPIRARPDSRMLMDAVTQTLEEWETKVRNPLGACLVVGSLGLRTDRVYVSRLPLSLSRPSVWFVCIVQ